MIEIRHKIGTFPFWDFYLCLFKTMQMRWETRTKLVDTIFLAIMSPLGKKATSIRISYFESKIKSKEILSNPLHLYFYF